MPKLLHKIALAWMLVWLPLSGVMACTLPFCGKGIGGWVAMQRAQAAHDSGDADAAQDLPPCHMTQRDSAAQDHTGHDDNASTGERSPVPGEHCSLCHLAGAIALPVMPHIPPIVAGATTDAPFTTVFHSWLGEPPQPPPLSSPA